MLERPFGAIANANGDLHRHFISSSNSLTSYFMSPSKIAAASSIIHFELGCVYHTLT